MRQPILTFLIMTLLLSGMAWAASAGDVVINELMWMGSAASSYDEWIELRNMTSSEINLSNWDITKYTKETGEPEYTEKIMLTIPAGKTIAANGYFLISNYASNNSNIADGITPDVVDASVSLSNTKLQIKLYDGTWNDGGTLIDTADDGVGDPPKGSNETPKKSMARKDTPGDGTDPDNWFTANTRWGWDTGAEEWGTPSVSNSTPTLVQLSALSASFNGGKVVIDWTTSSEMDHAGWNIYQSDGKGGKYVKLNDKLIPGSGDDTTSQHYQYVDESVVFGKRYSYYLESIDLTGNGMKSIIISVSTGRALRARGKLAVVWGAIKSR